MFDNNKKPNQTRKKMVIVPGNYGELYFSGLNRHLIWERFEPIPHCKMPWPFKPWWSGHKQKSGNEQCGCTKWASRVSLVLGVKTAL